MLWLRWLARKFWLLAVSIVIALAILVQTGRVLSPQVEKYRPQISAWLSDRLGAPVQMGRLSLRWQALEVALQLDDLRLGENGEVQMGYGLFHLDLLASLWNRELVWKNLQIYDFSAELSRSREGRWHIEGFPYAKTPKDPQSGPEMHLGDPVRIFQLGPKVQVRNARIALRLADGQAAQLNLPQVLLENSGQFHRLVARAFIAHSGENSSEPADGRSTETLRLVLEGQGNPRDKTNFSIKGYAQLNELLIDEDIVALIHQLTPLPKKYYWGGRKRARGSLWLHSDSERGYQLRGRLDLAQQAAAEQSAAAVATGATGDEDGAVSPLTPLESLAGDVAGEWEPGHGWRLGLQNIRLNWRELEIPPFNLQARGTAGSGLRLALDRIDLVAWERILGSLQVLPEKAEEWVSALKPAGQVENIQFVRDGDKQIALSANLRNVSASAYRGAPAVQGINGYLRLNGSGGRVELEAGDDFSMHFPQLYRQAFHFDSVRGSVAWSVDPQNNSVQVNSGPLRLLGDLGDVRGQFLLELPFRAHSRAADLTLMLGLRDAPVSAQKLLVPDTVSDSLRNWLDGGIGGQNPGRVSRAGFIYRGTSYRDGDSEELQRLGAHEERQTVQLVADLSDTDLDYAAGWPVARGVDARLLVNDRHVQVNASGAKLWGIDARQIEVGVAPNPTGEGSLLGVHAELEGPAADGLRLLQQSPLRQQLGGTFDDWKLEGRMQGTLTLSQPLGGATLPARQAVEVDLKQGVLGLPNLNLQIADLQGRIHYDSDNGLKGTQLRGDLWGHRLNASVQHLGERDRRDTQVVVTGRSTTAAVRQWSGRPELDWLRGEFGYQALVTIPSRAREKPYSAVFELTSDLVGVAADLPAPLAKQEQESTKFVLRVPIGAEGSLFHLSYGEHLQGQFWLVDGRMDRAAIALNAEVRLPPERGITISGDLARIDLPYWSQLLQVYASDSPDTPDLQDPLPVSLDISTDRLELGATGIEHILVRGRGLGVDWQLQFESETASGQLSGVLNGATPLQLNLHHLSLPPLAEKQQTVAGMSETLEDRWAGYDFSNLPRVDFSTDSLQMGDEDFGPWSLRLRPSSDRLVVSDIRGTLRGVTVEGRGEGDNRLGAQLMWIRAPDGSESSQFIGRLRTDNLANVLAAWGHEPLIESEHAGFDIALRWDGSPALVASDRLSGELGIDIRKGRFLRTTGNTGSALLRLLSLFNFDTWARRLRLDFSDLYQGGMAFDQVRGEIFFEGDGQLLIAVPIQVQGPTSELQMAGRVNLEREDLNLTLVATLPVGNNLALVAALAGGLPAAAGVYLISKAFKKQVNKVASVSYRISGDWADPRVRFDRLFDDDGARRQGSTAELEAGRGVRRASQPQRGSAGKPDGQVPEQSPLARHSAEL